MYIRNRYISGIYKAVLCLSGLIGILIQAGVFVGNVDWSVVRYYTLISNVLCCLYFGVAMVYAFAGKDTLLPWLKGMLIMGITVTGLVYHFMLSKGSFSMGSAKEVANILLHYLVPVLSVFDWVLFDKKGRYTLKSPLIWVILPDLYFVFATIYGFAGGQRYYGGSRFPYFFIDFDALGVWKVLAYTAVLNVLFAALGYVFYLADRVVGKKKAAH